MTRKVVIPEANFSIAHAFAGAAGILGDLARGETDRLKREALLKAAYRGADRLPAGRLIRAAEKGPAREDKARGRSIGEA